MWKWQKYGVLKLTMTVMHKQSYVHVYGLTKHDTKLDCQQVFNLSLGRLDIPRHMLPDKALTTIQSLLSIESATVMNVLIDQVCLCNL